MIYSSDNSICVVVINDLLFSMRNPSVNTIGVTLETSHASYPLICKKSGPDVSAYSATIDLKLLNLGKSDSIFINYSDAIGEIKTAKAGWVETLVSVYENPREIPSKFDLLQNYPNPFNPSTTIKYTIPIRCHVEIQLFDILGREMKTLVNDLKEPGMYEILFNANNLSSGVYFYRIQAGDYTTTKKFILIK